MVAPCPCVGNVARCSSHLKVPTGCHPPLFRNNGKSNVESLLKPRKIDFIRKTSCEVQGDTSQRTGRVPGQAVR